MDLKKFYELKDDFHKRIDDVFLELESNVPKEKGVNADLTDIAVDAWDLWKKGIGDIATIAGDAYGTYIG